MSKKKSESAEPGEPVDTTDAQAFEKVLRAGEVTTTPKAVAEAKEPPPRVSRKEGLGKPRGWAKRPDKLPQKDKP